MIIIVHLMVLPVYGVREVIIDAVGIMLSRIPAKTNAIMVHSGKINQKENPYHFHITV